MNRYAGGWKTQQTKTVNVIQYAMQAAFLAVIVIAFFLALKIGIDRSEKAECIKWSEWADEYPLYYSTDWQLEQCKAHGISLPR